MDTLAYETRTLPPKHPDWYRASIWLAVVPMVVGTLVFCLWLLVRWDWLMIAGWTTIIGGFASVAAGFVWLVAYVTTELRAGNQPLRTLGIRVVVALALLGVNFPLAATYMSLAMRIRSRYWITFANQTSVPIHSIIVTDGKFQQQFGPLASGARIQHYIRAQIDEGSLTFSSADARGATAGGTIDGYVTTNMPGNATITFNTTDFEVKRGSAR